MPRGNPDKLQPVRNKQEASEKGRKGGIRSGEVRRERKTLADTLKLLLTDGNIQKNLCLALIDEATKSDKRARAFETIRDTIGENPDKNISVTVETPDTTKQREYIKASLDLWEYCKLKVPEIYREDAKYLKEICRAIQDFEENDDELLVINAPPRHGKSLTATLASQWLLGRNSRLKLITTSYNEKMSRQFSKAVRDSIAEIKIDADRGVFSDIFPGVAIQHGSATADWWRLEGSPVNNYLATSPKASLTGAGGELIIIDDIVKNAYEANHRGILDDHFEWFQNTLYSRLEGRRKLLIIQTRWATKDLAGRVTELYKEQGRKIRIITKKAFDGVNMLNERILNKKDYDNLIQTIGEDIVKANYDQEPIDLKGRLYGEFVTYKEKPTFKEIHAFVDTADGGGDYLCCIIYGVHDNKAYVLDVLYTQDSMDTTERELVKLFIEFQVDEAVFESNFGGKAFVKVIERLSLDAGNKRTVFRSFAQTANKEAKILASSTTVTRHVYMPELWSKMWAKFYNDVKDYQRQGTNDHDDAPDALSEVALRVSKGTVKLIGQR